MAHILWDLTRAKLAIERNEKVAGFMGSWNAGHADLLPARMLG